MNPTTKPLGIKNYGNIGHLPGSRIGHGDHHVHEGQAKICCEKSRDKRDVIIVTEKLDGSNCGVAKIGNNIIALGRAGWLAESSPYEQHHLFADWVHHKKELFDAVIGEGERFVGEWLALAHSTKYRLTHGPFVVFDIMNGTQRVPWDEVERRSRESKLPTPHVISRNGPVAIGTAMSLLGEAGFHGAVDPVEGAVWRVERDGKFDFMAKYVRPDKVDGSYLPEFSGKDSVWNWRPKS